MKKVLVTTLVLLVLALVVAIIYCVDITKDRDALNTTLRLTQTSLDLTQIELSSTELELDLAKQTLISTQTELETTKQTLTTVEDELKDTKDELEDTQDELEEAEDELEDTQDELEEAEDELEDTQDELEEAEDELEDAQDELEEAEDELEVAQETLAGLGITLSESKECYDAELIDNPSATNPTWSKLMSFLYSDKTEKNTYIKDMYDCSDFSRDVHNNAEAAGIRAAVVHIDYKYKEVGHALNAFLTTAGLVYVDCTGKPDKIAYVKRGKDYKAVKIGTIGGANLRDDFWWNELNEWYGDPPGTSIVSSIKIYW
jgi:peptidoglycan hydrolase CwlO-like protein